MTGIRRWQRSDTAKHGGEDRPFPDEVESSLRKLRRAYGEDDVDREAPARPISSSSLRSALRMATTLEIRSRRRSGETGGVGGG